MACSQFDLDRMASLITRIIAYEEAITALGSDATILSYMIDTGQGKQSVTRQDIKGMESMVSILLNQLKTYEARCGINGGGVLYAGASR